MTRFCANCGTEVDETAAFCPTCGQPIDQADEVGIPPAPAWPEPSPQAEVPPPVDDSSPAYEPPPAPSAPPAEPRSAPEPASAAAPSRAEPNWSDLRYQRATGRVRGEDPTRAEIPPPAGAVPPPPASGRASPSAPAVNLPITWPVTLSGWLIGGGALVGAIGALIGLFGDAFNPIDLLLLLLLIGIAVTVFLSANVPAVPQLRLATLVVALIGFGMGLDRIGFGGVGVGALLLFLGTAAAGIGCILLELGRDEPLGGPRP
jgi:zinc-ribbon domain